MIKGNIVSVSTCDEFVSLSHYGSRCSKLDEVEMNDFFFENGQHYSGNAKMFSIADGYAFLGF